MAVTLNDWAIFWFASMSTTAIRTAPAPSMNSFAGNVFFFIAWHGPHHSALKSSRTRDWSAAAASLAAARVGWNVGRAVLVEAGSAANAAKKLKIQSSKLKRIAKPQVPVRRARPSGFGANNRRFESPQPFSPLTPALSPLRGEGAQRTVRKMGTAFAAPGAFSPGGGSTPARQRTACSRRANTAAPSPLNGERAGVRGKAVLKSFFRTFAVRRWCGELASSLLLQQRIPKDIGVHLLGVLDLISAATAAAMHRAG